MCSTWFLLRSFSLAELSYGIILHFSSQITIGKGALYHSDGSIFKGQFVGDEKVEGVVHLEDGILRRERYVNGVLQQD